MHNGSSRMASPSNACSSGWEAVAAGVEEPIPGIESYVAPQLVRILLSDAACCFARAEVETCCKVARLGVAA